MIETLGAPPIVTLDASNRDTLDFLGALDIPDSYRKLQRQATTLLNQSPFACVLRGTEFLDFSSDQRDEYVRRLTTLFGSISDDNRFDTNSGVFVDAVSPTEPDGRDVTFALGACEAHSDESSKIFPEDVALLWCVRPAKDGGDSLLWPADDLRDAIAKTEKGPRVLDILHQNDFLFGGKLRNPPRVLRAPIFFGEDGVRFRLGSLQDAREVVGAPFPVHQRDAITKLVEVITSMAPYRYRLQEGDVLVMMNRKVLHARENFTDTDRLLLRTRCFNQELSNSSHDRAEWAL